MILVFIDSLPWRIICRCMSWPCFGVLWCTCEDAAPWSVSGQFVFHKKQVIVNEISAPPLTRCGSLEWVFRLSFQSHVLPHGISLLNKNCLHIMRWIIHEHSKVRNETGFLVLTFKRIINFTQTAKVHNYYTKYKRNFRDTWLYSANFTLILFQLNFTYIS